MKNNIVCLLLLVLVTSCDSFLTSHEKDKIIPSKASHFKELIYGELVEGNKDVLSITDIMSDQTTMKWFGGMSAEETYPYPYYIWQKMPEYDVDGEVVPDVRYGDLYADVLLCNSIEDLLKDVTDEPSEVVNLYGEVLYSRAYTYWVLSTLYGYPYVDEALSRTTPCVPLNEERGIDNLLYSRATQRQIFDKMERDIEQSIDYFQKSEITPVIFRPNLKAAYILATRIFLTEKKYDKVIQYANALEKDFDDLCDLDEFYKSNNGQIGNVMDGTNLTTFFNKRNSEIAYTSGSFQLNPYWGSTFSRPLRKFMENGVTVLYGEADLRSKVFFDAQGQPCKLKNNDNTIFGVNIRLSEALLNRAEAYLMLGQKEKALDDLDRLRERRYEKDAGYRVDRSKDATLLVRNERAMELCFEGLRWNDLRRWGCPRIVHQYVEENNVKKEYVLEENDVAYTLPLPMKELERNNLIENVVRPDREGTIVTDKN